MSLLLIYLMECTVKSSEQQCQERGGKVPVWVIRWCDCELQSFTQVWLTLGRKDFKQKGQELVFLAQFSKDGADGWERSHRHQGFKPEKTKWAVVEHSRWFMLLA